jgi:ABC-type multidrug transport system fused ATPase/permease subunit
MQQEKKASARPSPLYMASMARVVKAECLFLVALACFFLAPGTEWSQNYLLARWVEEGSLGGFPPIAIAFMGSALLYALITAFSTPLYFHFFLRCSTKLHFNMFRSIMAQPMVWFDTTPVGRILNVFAGDMMELDLSLPRTFQHWQHSISVVAIALIPATILVPYIAPFVIVLIGMCVVVYRAYGDVSVEMQRLYLMGIGPILTSFSSYLQGLDTIRAFDRGGAFVAKYDAAISQFMDVSYWQAAIDRLGQFLVGGPFVSLLFMLPLSIILLYLKADPTVAALLMFYGSAFAIRLPGAMFSTVMVERSMVAAQRLVEYIRLPHETALGKGWTPETPSCITSSEQWRPSAGKIELRGVSMRYSANLPLVLKNVSITIEPGTKIGVVGRTGAGKSSLVLAVFRMMELEGGSLSIDGCDISSVPVRQLRASLGMIPQDTFMFSGTIRDNLDVAGSYTDENLWHALEQVRLKDQIEDLDGKLDHAVQERGSNLSAGTVQLICLARVLLKKPQVIFMDEATASVDLETDTMVQQTIRRAFDKCTIVTIAHRLNTVIDFDKILVMDSGSVAEYDCPSRLLEKPDGAFSKLVNSTGEASAIELRTRASNKGKIVD